MLFSYVIFNTFELDMKLLPTLRARHFAGFGSFYVMSQTTLGIYLPVRLKTNHQGVMHLET